MKRLPFAAIVLAASSASPALAQYTLITLASFSPSGGSPQGGVVLSNGVLYGTLSSGGSSDDGAVFSVPVSGGAPTTLASFNGTDGSAPEAGLMISGNTLYGATASGGSGVLAGGTVFSLPITGGTPTVLGQFSDNGNAGYSPTSGLLLSGSTLYGTNDGFLGVVYSLPISGGTPTALNGLTTEFEKPTGGLVLSGTQFYGTTNNPSVYSLSITGGTPTILTNFEGTDAESPLNGAVLSGTTLYGTTQNGGGTSLGEGIVFSESITGGSPTVLYSFDVGYGNPDDGQNPDSSLLLSNGVLYGETEYGGLYDQGTVFSLPVSGGTPTILENFNAKTGTGALPIGGLVMDSNGDLFGTTEGVGGGGTAATVFELAVPEPTFAGFIAIASLGLLARIRRHAAVTSPATT